MMNRSFAQRMAAVFGTAATLLFFSEFYFLNEGPVLTVVTYLQDSPLRLLASFAEFVLLYALMAYIFLIVIGRFQVQTINQLFLAGVLFGWATEALFVPVVYEAVPFSFIFPSVSWHALVDVMVGWYLVRRVMRLSRVTASALMFVLLGVVWAGWATWFWAEPDLLAPLTPGGFAAYAVVTAALWIAGMFITDRAGVRTFEASRWEVVGVVVVTVGLFGITALPFLPLSLLLLPLIGLTLAALNRDPSSSRNRLAVLWDTSPAGWQYPLALLTPGVAAMVYPLFYTLQRGIPTEDITFVLLLVGTIWLLIALIRPFVR